MVGTYTNFYVTWSGKLLTLVSLDISEEGSNQKSEEEEDKNRQEPSETNLFYYAWTHNKEYSGLCQRLGLAGAEDLLLLKRKMKSKMDVGF